MALKTQHMMFCEKKTVELKLKNFLYLPHSTRWKNTSNINWILKLEITLNFKKE
jgi:hypothetical protein